MAAIYLALLLLLTTSGCAIGRIYPDRVDCIAIGHAKCKREADGSAYVQGGAISNNFAEAFGALITAAGVYFTGAGVP